MVLHDQDIVVAKLPRKLLDVKLVRRDTVRVDAAVGRRVKDDLFVLCGRDSLVKLFIAFLNIPIVKKFICTADA